MLDTVLNLGLNDASVEGLAARTGNERFAWDSYRRFVQMFGNVVLGIEGRRFEDLIAAEKRERGVREDTELGADSLRALTARFQELYDFPADPADQLRRGVRAVFDSWTGQRAVDYRRINRIPDTWGTAVNVQQMVFGNKGDSSGSGVAFSRDEVTGAREPSGDFLPNAQGEDVVSGVRTRATSASWPSGSRRSTRSCWRSSRPWSATTATCRTPSSRSRKAASTCSRRATPSARRRPPSVRRRRGRGGPAGARGGADDDRRRDPRRAAPPDLRPEVTYEVLATGVAASPGAAKGELVFSAAVAVEAAAEGRDVILARPFTEADDVAGFHAAVGILTSEGGKASHAALVARGMGVPAVTGAASLEIDPEAGEVRVGGEVVLRAGDRVAIDGSAGAVTANDVPLVQPQISEAFQTVLGWSDEVRRLGIRANADTPEDSRKAREFGAEGIGLCRTEHMFFGAERNEAIVAVILADTDEGRRKGCGSCCRCSRATSKRSSRRWRDGR